MRHCRAARLMAALIGLAALLFAPISWAAGPTVVLDPARQPQRLLGAGEFWLDPTGTSTIEQVTHDQGVPWKMISENEIFQLQRQRALWVRFTVRADAKAASDHWYLEVPSAAVDTVTLYTATQDGWHTTSAGDLLRVSTWPVPHRHPMLPLALSAGGEQTYYVRIVNSHSFSAPAAIRERGGSRSLAEQQIALWLGIYFGLAALAFVMAVHGAVTLKDLGFALYALTVLSMTLTQASLTGIGGLHLWGEFPWWNDMAPFVLPVIAGGCMIGFIGEVVSLGERSALVQKLVNGFALLAVPLTVGILLTDPATRFRMMLPYVVATIPMVVAVMLWALRRGDRYAPWLLAGNIPVAVGALFPVARTAGMIPATFLTTYSMQFGLALELPILMMMLLRRSQQRRDYIRRLKGLDRIDPATGLLNEAVFRERLARLIARSVRLKYRSAILLVDITNLEQIRRDFDRQAAQELPLRAWPAACCRRRARSTAWRACRTTASASCWKGPLKAGEVAEAAPRIVARCLMPFRNRPLGWSAQVRVAQALIPMDGTDPQQLVGQLEALLATTASHDGKRAVFNLSRPPAMAPRYPRLPPP